MNQPKINLLTQISGKNCEYLSTLLVPVKKTSAHLPFLSPLDVFVNRAELSGDFMLGLPKRKKKGRIVRERGGERGTK